MKDIFQQLLKDIPDYQHFLTPEELDQSSRDLEKAYPGIVSLFEMGKTKNGVPLLCLKIGSGSQNALMFGCPHPNEPIGTMMLEYFTQALCKNDALREELDYTWYVVKAWDRDGLELNEQWLKGPYTLYNYSRNFFRPAGHKQVDWTFPIDYKELHFHAPIPETQAMMKLIEEIKPRFIYSLHNAGFGGAYWYITDPTPELYDEMRQTAKQVDVPLHLGEPEAPYCQQLSPAIYGMLGIRENYDYLEQYGHKNIAETINVGTSSSDYAKGICNAFTLLTELPYFYDERINDLSDADITRAQAALESLDWHEKASQTVRDTLALSKQYMDAENPFLLALEAFSKDHGNDATRKMIETNPEFAKTATVAEKFDNLTLTKFYQSLSYGMLVRANETELEKMKESGEVDLAKRKALEKAYAKAIALHQELVEWLENDIHYQVVPIRKLVYIQLANGLLYADKLKG